MLLAVWLCGMMVGTAVGLASQTTGGHSLELPGPSCSGAGILLDWTVTDDNGTLLCEDPSLFERARQIQCE